MRTNRCKSIMLTACWLCSVSSFTAMADMAFAPSGDYTVGASPAVITIAIDDLDGDGNLDLVTANYFSNDVSVLMGNGDGTFQAAEHIEAGTNPADVAVTDLNGDEALDLAVANYPEDFSILLGNGDGTFQYAGSFGSTGCGSIDAGDLNGDGHPDLVVTCDYQAQYLVYLGNGDGTFQPGMINGTAYPNWVTIGDLDGDGHLDLAMNHMGYIVTAQLGDGDGNFPISHHYGSPKNSYHVDIGDLNGDGIPDLAVAADYWGFEMEYYLSILLGAGDGTYPTVMYYETSCFNPSVAIGDLDEDGVPDLASAARNDGVVTVFPGNGDGTFQMAESFAVAGGPDKIAIADLDNDTDLDVAVTCGSGSVSVLLNQAIESDTLAVELFCDPLTGTVPFTTMMSATLINLEPVRPATRISATIDVILANGAGITGWRQGTANMAAGGSYNKSWFQAIPAYNALIGDNRFTLTAEDVTPAPYNQPPYAPAGDTDTDSCQVIGLAPR